MWDKDRGYYVFCVKQCYLVEFWCVVNDKEAVNLRPNDGQMYFSSRDFCSLLCMWLSSRRVHSPWAQANQHFITFCMREKHHTNLLCCTPNNNSAILYIAPVNLRARSRVFDAFALLKLIVCMHNYDLKMTHDQCSWTGIKIQPLQFLHLSRTALTVEET